MLRNVVDQYPGVFVTREEPVTVTPYCMCTIRQTDDEVIWGKPYPTPVKYHDEINKQIKMEESVSAWTLEL